MTSKTFPENLKSLIDLEEGNYATAKQTIKQRNLLRKSIKESLTQEQELTESSDFYAGLAKTNGRISWRKVTEELIEKYDLDKKEVGEITECCRNSSSRLKYGRRTKSF